MGDVAAATAGWGLYWVQQKEEEGEQKEGEEEEEGEELEEKE